MAELRNQATARPTRKVTATWIAGLVTAIVASAVDYAYPALWAEHGPSIAAGVTAIVVGAAGYITRERA